MTRFSRRQIIRLGAAGGVLSLTQLPVAAQESQESSAEGLTEAEATYIMKHAVMRAATYKKFSKRWSLSTNQIEEQFLESLPVTPSDGLDSISLEDILIHFTDIATGGRLGDLMTLSWYADSFKTSGIKSVYNKGIIAGGDITGEGGVAANEASSQNESLASAAMAVANAASSCISDLSKDNLNELRNAINNESDILDNQTGTIEEWTFISPGSYSIQGIGPGDEGAQTVRDLAILNAESINAFNSMLQEQVDAIEETEVQLTIPRFLTIYQENIDEFASKIPGWARGEMFGASLNVYFMDSEGATEQETINQAVNVKTKTSGKVSSYQLTPAPDAEVHIYTTSRVIEEISESPQPVKKAQSALGSGRIILKGQGWVNVAKYETGPWVLNTGEDIWNAAEDLIDSIWS